MKASSLEPTRTYHPYREQSFSEEVDSRGGDEDKQNTNKKKKELDKGDGDGDGATIELPKRPRGRPPGSKNKPKPPLIITREDPSSPSSSSSAFRPHILEIAAGRDIAASLVAYSRRSALGLCVLSATGPVADVTLRQPAGPAVTFRGRFDILSISAALFPPTIAGGAGAGGGGFSLSLAGPSGQIVGGLVAGPLVAAGTVVVVAAGFANPTFHRLPAEDGEAAEPPPAVSGGGGEASVHRHLEEEEERDGSDDRSRDRYEYDHHQQEEQQHQLPARRGPAGAPPDIYGGRFSPDIVWPPTARPPPPPY